MSTTTLSLSDGKRTVTIHDVVGGHTDRLDTLIRLYENLMPDWSYYSARMREIAESPSGCDPRMVDHQWLAEVDGQPVGFTLFKYIAHRHCGIGFGLAVEESHRTFTLEGYQRLSHILNRLSVVQIGWDALLRQEPVPAGLVVEVGQPPAYSDPQTRKLHTHLRNRYLSYGLRLLDVDYYEPPAVYHSLEDIDPDRSHYKRPLIGVFPIPGTPFDPSNPEALANMVMAFHIDHYGLPYDHWAVKAALSRS